MSRSPGAADYGQEWAKESMGKTRGEGGMNQFEKIAALFQAVLDRELKDDSGLIGVGLTAWQTLEVHVTYEYFNEHFGRKNYRIDPRGDGRYDLHFTTEAGAKIFCLSPKPEEQAA
jgi:hypothetical protein